LSGHFSVGGLRVKTPQANAVSSGLVTEEFRHNYFTSNRRKFTRVNLVYLKADVTCQDKLRATIVVAEHVHDVVSLHAWPQSLATKRQKRLHNMRVHN